MTGYQSKKAAALDEEGFYTVHPKDEDDDIQVYQRPWVGLTEAQFLEATRLAENGNYLVAFVRIQEWLKEQNT